LRSEDWVECGVDNEPSNTVIIEHRLETLAVDRAGVPQLADLAC
jgi:hypothetical protein